jgi:uncharacterized protein YceH (UPF0502 family)
MNDPLDAVAVRVLGSLMEKQVTTPDNYPLTLNALVIACNQTSNRNPVLALTEKAVSQSLKELSQRSLAREVHRSDSRAKRYRHLMEETLHLHLPEVAVLCVLMLRGPQTSGEIRTRTARLFEFADLTHVGVTLQSLITLETPLVAELPVRPGQKEVRYAQLLSGLPEPDSADSATDLIEATFSKEATGSIEAADGAGALEEAVESLRSELADLRREFDEFRKQFQ